MALGAVRVGMVYDSKKFRSGSSGCWVLILWYVGFVFSCVGFMMHMLALARGRQNAKVRQTVPRRETETKWGNGLMGLRREVPPMGGFFVLVGERRRGFAPVGGGRL